MNGPASVPPLPNPYDGAASGSPAHDPTPRRDDPPERTSPARTPADAGLTYVPGPGGMAYAVGGEMPIHLSEVPGDPRATEQEADQVLRAVMASPNPTPQDLSVAASARALAAQARMEMAQQAAAGDGLNLRV